MRCRWSDDIIQNSRREIDNTLHVDIGYFYARFSTAVDHTSNADFPFPALNINAGNALHQLTELNKDIYMNFVTRIAVSISDKTPCCKISWSHAAARFGANSEMRCVMIYIV